MELITDKEYLLYTKRIDELPPDHDEAEVHSYEMALGYFNIQPGDFIKARYLGRSENTGRQMWDVQSISSCLYEEEVIVVGEGDET